jgi:RimJ/RimL family protein N-acetyltransferase
MTDRQVVLGDVALRIREIRGADSNALMAMHRAFSDRTVYQRFFHAMPELAPDQAERFTHVDGALRYALVAEKGDGRLVAVGRYDRIPEDPSQAEIAVVVADDFQHRGLGTLLVTELKVHAQQDGVAEFVADVLINNRGMQHAFADAGLRARAASYDGGVAHLVLPLS